MLAPTQSGRTRGSPLLAAPLSAPLLRPRRYPLGVIDSFSGTSASGLASPADNGGAITLSGGPIGNWTEGGGVGVCTPTSAGGTVRTEVIACQHDDGDFYIDFSVDTQAVGGNQIVFFYVRVQNTTLTDYGARIRVVLAPTGTPAQVGAINRNINSAGVTVGPAAINVPGDIAPAQLMRMHVYMEGGFYALNVWPVASAEPVGWLVQFTDNAGYLNGGFLAIGQQSLAGNTNLSPVRYDRLAGQVASAVPFPAPPVTAIAPPLTAWAA